MSVPKKRKCRSAVRTKRSHHALEEKSLGTCPNCAKPVMPHRACTNCGQYRGRIVLNTSKKVKKTA